MAYYKEEAGVKYLVIVPKRKTIPRGTLAAILEQAQLSREEFLKLLRD
jgi:predicted RNA binding protein YcfA (HicA-like mRNA interferase family)